MDIHQSVIDYLLTIPIFDVWHKMSAILRRVASTRPRDWKLPILVYQVVGESPEKAIPASAALACAQISIILVDDMLDKDPRGGISSHWLWKRRQLCNRIPVRGHGRTYGKQSQFKGQT